MASTRPFDLNSAVSDFSITLVREKITQLKNECEKDLEPDAMQIRDLLRHVDQKRLKFSGGKQRLLDDLRTTLSSIQADSDTINTVTADLEKLTPAWLNIIPTAASLAIRLPTPAASTTPPFSDTDVLDATVQPEESDSKRRWDDTEVHERPDKKPRIDGYQDETRAVELHVSRTLSMSELDRIECVFTHSEREGFWVVRCPANDCTLRISNRPPFENRSAFNHFNSRHLRQTQTEESIFSQYAYKIEDATVEAVASRYDDGKIPECTPSREIPVSMTESLPLQSLRRTRRSTLTRLLHETTSESEPEKTPDNSHHNLRQRTKPPYGGVSHSRTSSVLDDLSHTTRTKPTGPRKSKSSGLYKPFGHTGEWPRRSAPS